MRTRWHCNLREKPLFVCSAKMKLSELVFCLGIEVFTQQYLNSLALSTHFACDIKSNWPWWQQVEDLWRESSICAVWNWLKCWKSHQVCRGFIWAEMREQQEVGTIGQSENKEGRVKNRLFQISVRELISILAEKYSNEESSILRLQSITSCSVVGWDGWVSFQEIQVIFEGKK